jgi:hypothetical protein
MQQVADSSYSPRWAPDKLNSRLRSRPEQLQPRRMTALKSLPDRYV